jgi:hypothetical protein
MPRLAGIVAAHHIPVLLHEQHAGTRPVHGDAVHAVADLRIRIRQLIRGLQAAVHRLPRLAGVVGAEYTRRRDGNEETLGMARV